MCTSNEWIVYYEYYISIKLFLKIVDLDHGRSSRGREKQLLLEYDLKARWTKFAKIFDMG
jgi:hypothetical protein